MRSPVVVLAMVAIAAGLSGCDRKSSTSTPPAAAPVPPIQEVMANAFTPQSTQLWEIAGKLYDDDGNIDAGLLDDAHWATLSQVATRMRAAAAGLQEVSGLQVAAPGVKLQGEETPGSLGAAQIKALIEAAPQDFAAAAGELVAVADEVLAAVEARDGHRLDELSGRLNEVYTACHTRFWYPEQGGE